jgi:hypothetical protein
VAGELLSIGTRPKLVACFEPPGAEARFQEWEAAHAEALGEVPVGTWRVEYGRAPGGGLFVRVRIDEEHLPDGFASG